MAFNHARPAHEVVTGVSFNVCEIQGSYDAVSELPAAHNT